MDSPFQGQSGGQTHLPHPTSYAGSQGRTMNPGVPIITPEAGSERPLEMDTSSGTSQPGSSRESSAQKDISISILCRVGQETVQEVISRAAELFSLLKNMQPPNGTPASISQTEERKAKAQELIRTINFCFKKLRSICERCNYSSTTLEYTHIEVDSLIPLKDEATDSRQQDDRRPTDALKANSVEYNKYLERIFLRNKQLKEIIDNLRVLIWDINTMLAMRKE